MEKQFDTPPKYISILLGILVFLGIYLTSHYDYLLFHSLAEIFSIVVACTIFMIAWNSRRFLDNNYLLFIGIAYLFVSGLDLIHTLAYKGMNIFQGYETNLPTQLWIATRYVQSLSLFIAPFFFGRKLKINYVFLGYAVVTSLLFISIFYWDIFPVCLIEGVGLTPFKKISEYIISLILLGSIFLLLKNRSEFDRKVLQWIVWSIIVTIASELAFTFYIDAYGLSNLIGHFFEILSFYFIYKAIIETGLNRPYDLLFRNLKQSEERFRNIFEQSPIGIELYDLDGRLLEVNKGCIEIFGVSDVAEVKGFKLFEDPNLSDEVKERLKKGEPVRYEVSFDFEKVKEFQLYKTTKTGIHYMDALITPFGLEGKTSLTGYLVQVQDITRRKQAEEALQKAYGELEIRVQERTAELAKANKELQAEITERKKTEKILIEQSRILEAFFTSTITPLVFLDKDFNFIRVNEAYAKACQRDVSEFPGHNHFEFYPSDAKGIFEQVVKTKEPFQVFARPFVFPDHPEWGVTYWNWTLTPLLDETGEVKFLVFALEDVTEQKQAQDALRAISSYTRGLIEASIDPLVTISADGKVMDVNRATELVTGVPREQLIGSDFLDYFTEPEKAREGYQEVFSKGTVRDYPLAIRHSSGHITQVLYHATVYRNEAGEVQGIFAAARDITKRKRAEEALRESENRLRILSSQLLAVQENERKRISRELHDSIGQSLSAIKFRVENILQEVGESRVKPLEDLIPIIQESIEEARRIQMDLRPSILDDLGILATLSWFCREFEKIYSTIRIEKLVQIQENEVSTQLKTVIFRIMQEALNNVAKHSKANFILLSLRKTDGTIELTIQDNGQGFDLNEVLSIESSRRGLGLTSMRERAELSGGSFVIESVRGKGTIVRATWPL
jgi:PAS domain S-box-containing protein